MRPPARLLAWNWSIDQPPAIIHRIMGDRVLARGDNHQSLRADTVAKAHEEVIWMFINQMEELDDSEVDITVEMSIEDTLKQAVDKAVDACVSVLGLTRPSQEQIDEALQIAIGYTPKTKKTADSKKEAKSTPRYFGLLPEVDLVATLGPLFSAAGKDKKAFWDDLVKKDRITKRPHVTITHSNSLPDEGELWERCMGLHRMSSPPLFKFKLGHVIWNKRVMAVTVEDVEVESESGQEGQEFVSMLPSYVRHRLHVTVGTKDQSVPAVEAKGLVEEWRKGKAIDGVRTIDLESMVTTGRVKGLFN